MPVADIRRVRPPRRKPRAERENLKGIWHEKDSHLAGAARPVGRWHRCRRQRGDRRRRGAQRGSADAFPDQRAEGNGLELRRPVRHLRQGAAAARPEGLQGSLLGLPFDEPGGVPHAGGPRLFGGAGEVAVAAEYTIHDGPNDAGDMFDRPGKPSDYFPAPFANEAAAAAANGGAAPPDMSLLAKARGVERGFPQLRLRHLHPVCRRAARTTSIRC